MTDEDDEGRFEGDDPSTMVVAGDDARHAELIASARNAQSTPRLAVAPAPAPKPIAVARPDERAPARSVSGTVDVPVGETLRPKFPLGLVVLVVLAIIGVAIAFFALR